MGRTRVRVGRRIATCMRTWPARVPAPSLYLAPMATTEPSDESEPEAFRLRGRLTGPVWASLPQSSQAAEHVGLVAGKSVACSVKRWWGDCMSVVKEAAMSMQQRLSPKRVYGGVWQALRKLPGADPLGGVAWTKGHVFDRTLVFS